MTWQDIKDGFTAAILLVGLIGVIVAPIAVFWL